MKANPDPILHEIWRFKDAAAAKHGGDPRAMAEELRKQQAAGQRRVVSRPHKRVKSSADQ